MGDVLTLLLPNIVGGAVAGLVMWGGLRVTLRNHAREITRAHMRLDAIHAPNVTVAVES